MENNNEAIESLFLFLKPQATTSASDSRKDLPSEDAVIDTEALQKDLEVAKVAAGLTNNKLIESFLKAKGGKVGNLTLEAFQELYSKIGEVSKGLPKEEKLFLLGFVQKKVLEFSRLNFYMYVKYMANFILPEGFIDGRHIKLMCNELQKVEEATSKGKPIRQMLFCPPGAMKSKLTNLFVSWCLGRHPKWNILHIGHGTKFVEDNAGRPIRDLMRTEEYLKVFPEVEIKNDSRAAGRWELYAGGKYYGAGARTQIAGRRAHISICPKNDSLVYLRDKGYVKAEEIKQGDLILGPNGYELIINKVDCHHKLMYNINSQVVVSPEHPFKELTLGWVEAKHLKIGDKLKVQSIWNKLKRIWKEKCSIVFGEVLKKDVVSLLNQNNENLIVSKG